MVFCQRTHRLVLAEIIKVDAIEEVQELRAEIPCHRECIARLAGGAVSEIDHKRESRKVLDSREILLRGRYRFNLIHSLEFLALTRFTIC